jgi:hypothetical protein
MKIRRFLVIAFCALAAALSLTFGVRKFATFGPLAGHTIPATAEISPLIRSLRPNYPFSVIPGGAYSSAELHYANQSDAVVRAHYADFNLKRAHIVQVTDDRFQFASYRINDRIYWTRKKLRIHKGEYLLTDGLAFARTRCGNRLSETPQAPVSLQEPAEALLSMPPIRPEMLPKLELAQAPPVSEVADPAPRLAPVLPNSSETLPLTEQAALPAPAPPPPGPIFAGGPPMVRHQLPPQQQQPPPTFTSPPTTSQPPAILPVPEPSSLWLFVLTFCLSLWGMTRVLPVGKPKDPPK